MPTIDLAYYGQPPSSSLATTTIDLAYYPHIADSIFACAPPASLRVMRSVCRSWRSRADIALSGHISFRTTYTSYDEQGVPELSVRLFSVRDPSLRNIFTLGLNRGDLSFRSTGLVQSAIRVVDVDETSHKHFALTHGSLPVSFFEFEWEIVPPPATEADLHREMETYKAITEGRTTPPNPRHTRDDWRRKVREHRSERAVRYAALGAETFSRELDVGCVVLFAQNATSETKAAAYLDHIGRIPIRGSGKAVLHLLHPGPAYESLAVEWDEVTVIVHMGAC